MSHQDLVTDEQAAQAVVGHHRQLAAALAGHVTGLVTAADVGVQRQVWTHRDELVTWLHDELLPHAHAEEATLYPVAAELPAGKLLIDGMLEEHRTITALVAELAEGTSPVRVAASARALHAVFSGHLTRENELVVPLLVAAEGVSLATLLDGMHEIIGVEPAPAAADGCGCGGCGCGAEATRPEVVDLPPIGV
ncbi:hemerythrin domain-containing protein [Actinoplanes sp. NPDC049599]|uniref:hemerythrin domain-containing protein n=1 Tax=Actinoplanes sp. NPDC049599 TaxID=3363903 RepID=UPI0037A2D085